MKTMLHMSVLAAGLLWAALCQGASITLPGGNVSIPILSAVGASFTYTGTLTESDTIGFTQSGLVCLQGGGTYCTNGAGVVVVPGTGGIGTTFATTLTLGGFTGTWSVGSVLMVVSGVGAVQVFPANAASGLGSSSPPPSLTLPASTTLASLGFPAFTATNPTISFIVADNNYPDNSGSVTLSQTLSTPVPITPAGTALIAAALALAAVIALRRRTKDAS